LATLPSLSLAVAARLTIANAVNVAPLDGEVRDTVGATLAAAAAV